ncbi:MAG: lysophospholipid acyltransferase family protein [Elusimicrobiaceae bacterium]|jgi:lysophospholipid acyltransferase (LPLAT)-like uncharacterized protein|nr:lysophospholipid acyltransferase family protein [Elusimicrobiaceae bacterium]MBT3954579.1 lysophospholipid acyltransferase family protein [Elusimicrobiaceae bacterium]MBT4007887.1 lysophospholipid acyltransferase family protein [Elusimicrobiaceae bacterium]MBT4402573.1 lysophospholipid acyltransferase family protein [Elusimicrobiaceae bacterium]MBT4439901.1 lysophospholipid acyltransferase family protein [Elusimicrobiaceae bacterium]
MIDTLLTTRKKASFKYIIVAWLIYIYLMIVGVTKKIKHKFPENYKNLKQENKPCIYAFWHNQQAFVLYLTSKFEADRKVCCLISLSKDGEYIARTAHKFGIKAMRGSTSKGGFSALRGLIDIADANYSLAITPDGPRGPVYTIQPGIIYLAKKTGLPIVPVACQITNKISAGSWDKFQVPLPFGSASYVYGEPIHIAPDKDLKEARLELKDTLNQLNEQATQIIS